MSEFLCFSPIVDSDDEDLSGPSLPKVTPEVIDLVTPEKSVDSSRKNADVKTGVDKGKDEDDSDDPELFAPKPKKVKKDKKDKKTVVKVARNWKARLPEARSVDGERILCSSNMSPKLSFFSKCNLRTVIKAQFGSAFI